MTSTIDRPAAKLRVVGTNPTRQDAVDKVTGRAKYGADVQFTGMLWCKILRSPHNHAKILSIDYSKALKLPGVMGVATGQDFPAPLEAPLAETIFDTRQLGQVQVARERVWFKGHPVAAVAATSPHIAEEALGLIEVKYEELPFVIDPVDSMQDGAPVLHPENIFRGKPSNVITYGEIKEGDVEQGFKAADLVLEGTFRSEKVHQGYIEPHNATAYWSPEGLVTIWTSTQAPFVVRSQSAAILGLPVANVKIMPVEIGGGFGGKGPVMNDIWPAMLSKKTGRPVKYVMTRREVFEATGGGVPGTVKCKLGLRQDGRISAIYFHVVYSAGCWGGSHGNRSAAHALGPYHIPNIFAEGYDVATNRSRGAGYRAPGAPQVAFALETLLDEAAEKLNMDPMDLRLKNAARSGDRDSHGVPYPVHGNVEVMEAVKRHPHYTAPLGKNQGRGVAMAAWHTGGGPSAATLSLNSDGTVTLVTGSADLSGTRTSSAMQVAEVLGLNVEDVRSNVGDTDSVGWTGGSFGSRVAFATGAASIEAADKLLAELKRRAALLWETQVGEVAFEDGLFISKRDAKDRLTWKQLAARAMGLGGPVSVTAAFTPKGTGAPTFGATIVDVEVDPETGKCDVVRCTAIADVGKAVHPSQVESQMQGGAVQGLGWALNEEFYYAANGSINNPTFLDYRMPISLDLPMIDTQIIEVPNPAHPYGVRGVGEIGLASPIPATANAIAHVTGKRIRQLPLKPGRVTDAIHGTNGQPQESVVMASTTHARTGRDSDPGKRHAEDRAEI